MDFHIQTQDGVNHPVGFAGNLPVHQLLAEFITTESLKIHPREVASWELQDELTGEKLNLTKSLEQNGIKSGQRLRLVPAKPEPREERGRPSEGLKRCENGHFYDPARFTKCPYDGVQSIDFGSRSIRIGLPRGGEHREGPSDEGHTVPVRSGGGATEPSGDQYTRRIGQGPAGGIDAVVGWLVCVHGKNRGRDYRIRSENNKIGRSENMDICIAGDDLISREKHTVITFDPQHSSFYLSPGEGRSLVYLNGEAVLTHKELKAYDEILLGATKLRFIPFCGDKFKWS